MEPLEHITKRYGLAWAALGPVFVSVWDQAPTALDAVSIVELLGTIARSHPRMYMLTVTGPNCAPPNAEVREICVNEVRRRSLQLVAGAHVVEGSGYRSSAIRSVLSAMTLLMRSNPPHKIFASVGDGATFLANQSRREPLTARVSASSLVTAVQELRR